MFHGDCCDVLKGLPPDSIDFGIHSPPFSNLYIYSDSESDMGNCASDAEFFEHYKFAIGELFRVTVPGRLCVVHCKDLPKYANRDDTAGLKDFPGEIIRAFEARGWSYHSRVTIWKCPVTERERTNNNGLLHKTAERDRSQLRQGMADYLIAMRKPPVGTLMSDKPVRRNSDPSNAFRDYYGESDPQVNTDHPSPYARVTPSQRENGRSIDLWRRYAEPVWWDINQKDVLQYTVARDSNDERHICPLQVGVIERAVEIWTSPGDVVLSPFAGIGSEGYCAVKMGRKFVGVELKQSYFNVACGNLRVAEEKNKEGMLFSPVFDQFQPGLVKGYEKQ